MLQQPWIRLWVTLLAWVSDRSVSDTVFSCEFCCPQGCNFIKKETLAPVFSCEFCEIFNNNFFHRTHLVNASVCNTVSIFFPAVLSLSCILNKKNKKNNTSNLPWDFVSNFFLFHTVHLWFAATLKTSLLTENVFWLNFYTTYFAWSWNFLIPEAANWSVL